MKKRNIFRPSGSKNGDSFTEMLDSEEFGDSLDVAFSVDSMMMLKVVVK